MNGCARKQKHSTPFPSEVLIYENSQNPYAERQIFVTLVLHKARVIQELNDRLAKRAREIEALGIKGLDALHLACAERLKAGYKKYGHYQSSNFYQGDHGADNGLPEGKI